MHGMVGMVVAVGVDWVFGMDGVVAVFGGFG